MQTAKRLVLGLFALALPALCGSPCAIATPEPSMLWMIGGASGAILLVRKLRAKK